ncbi:hypothetical protein DFA_08332 [Cavenderia fasciculata]|uniref:Uncharacterized protein n=1 Tax=Cavenderia fasciculata TaxID=261658 RepID=F4Q5S8_CACFS|nr:uncharacterized protein DFA_08332 [Cavenderia fasciculata]EGG17337.1 hypothetical protein DFA_08332 [Cavenderia fasciculata]|eukprot:XP_004355821.1 hypothetical protein DFA_08332 [Cavenderia fasciculata]
MSKTEKNRFKESLDKVNNLKEEDDDEKEECTLELIELIVEIQDPKGLIDDLKITTEEMMTCVDLIEAIEKRLLQVDENEDYRIFVVGWLLSSIVLNQYKSLDQHYKEQLQFRIKSKYMMFIRFRTFRDLGKLSFILNDFDKLELDNLLINQLKKRTLFKLSEMIKDIKNERNVLFALMAIRALIYTGNGWDCIDDILNTGIVPTILTIVTDSFNIINEFTNDKNIINYNQNEKDTLNLDHLNLKFKLMYLNKSKKYIHLVCNESSKVIINITTTMDGIESIAKMDIIPILFKILSSYSNVNLKNIMQCALFMVGNITATKPEWRDVILKKHGLLKLIMEMGRDEAVMSQLSDEISNIFGSVIRCVDPPIEWREIIDYMLPFVCQHFLSNENTTRSVTKFLEGLSRHPSFEIAVFRQYRLDNFLLESLARDIDLFTDDWFFILESALWAITGISEKQPNNTIFTYERLFSTFNRLLVLVDNYQIIDHILYTTYELIRNTTKANIINSNLIKILTTKVSKLNNNNNIKSTTTTKYSDSDPLSVYRLIDRKFMIDDPSACQMLWNLLAILDGMSPMEIGECVSQGIILLLVTLYRSVKTTDTFSLIMMNCVNLTCWN